MAHAVTDSLEETLVIFAVTFAGRYRVCLLRRTVVSVYPRVCACLGFLKASDSSSDETLE